MSRDTKRKVSKWTMIICLTLVACFYIYPVFLMVMNSFKPFGEIIGDVLALPKSFDLSNYTYVVDKMKYLLLFRNNVIITAIGIAGIVVFSSMAAYILERREGRYCTCDYHHAHADSFSGHHDHTVKVHEYIPSFREQDWTWHSVLGIRHSHGNLYHL